MIELKQITEDSYAIIVDGDESIIKMQELLNNVPTCLHYFFTEEQLALLDQIKTGSWRQDSPT